MIQWYSIVKEFKKDWEILVNRKVEGVSDVPKIHKAVPIINWTEFFTNFLHQTVGEMNILLSCVIREWDTVPCVAPPMAIVESYS